MKTVEFDSCCCCAWTERRVYAATYSCCNEILQSSSPYHRQVR